MPSARILKDGKNAVADIFVQRHAALERTAVVLHHARAENRVRLARHERMIHLRQDFRRILPVAVQAARRCRIPFSMKVLVAGLLVAAIAQVLGVLQDLELV